MLPINTLRGHPFKKQMQMLLQVAYLKTKRIDKVSGIWYKQFFAKH